MNGINDIIDGVSEGQRKVAFYKYVLYLVSLQESPDGIENVIILWNKQNRPPLPEEWIRENLDWCFDICF